MRTFKNPQLYNHKGYTLIELMIAMTLGLFVLGGVLKIFSDNSRIYKVLDARSRMQENARYALYVLGRDMRMAGYMHCNVNDTKIANTINSTDWQFWAGSAVSGYEGGVDTFPTEFSGDVFTAPKAPENSDSIVIRRADSDTIFTISSHDTTAAVISFPENQPVQKGEIYIIADPQCTQLGIFQASDPATAGSFNSVTHNTGGSTSPGNFTKQLGGNFQVSVSGSNSSCGPSVPNGESCMYAYPPGSKVFKYLSQAYYIGTFQNIPTLFSEKITDDASTKEEVIVQGVENLQILYGIDTDADDITNQYVTADNVGTDEIISLRIDLLIRSYQPVADSPQKYIYQNTTVIPTDNFLRKEFSITIKLRNRGVL